MAYIKTTDVTPANEPLIGNETLVVNQNNKTVLIPISQIKGQPIEVDVVSLGADNRGTRNTIDDFRRIIRQVGESGCVYLPPKIDGYELEVSSKVFKQI